MNVGELVSRIREYNPSADAELVQRAYDFSAQVHRGQTRMSGEPYLTHPLEVANEGKVVVVVRPEQADAALQVLRDDPLGRECRIIGRVEMVRDGICEVRTPIGGCRILQKPYGEQLPRIC